MDYNKIFLKIEDGLKKNSGLSDDEFESEFSWTKNVNYKNMSNNEIYWILVYVAFYSGMNASTVSEKLPKIKKYFYDYEKVKEYSSDNIKKYLEDPDTIHHVKKVEGCVKNAKEFNNIIIKYGSFSNFIESFGDTTEEKTLNNISLDFMNRFSFLGERTVNHFMTDLGLDVLKPDRVVCRIFKRMGFIDNENKLDQAIKVGKEIALATGHPIRYVDIIFVQYGQMGDWGICLEKKPKCSVCEVTQYCDYYSNKQ